MKVLLKGKSPVKFSGAVLVEKESLPLPQLAHLKGVIDLRGLEVKVFSNERFLWTAIREDGNFRGVGIVFPQRNQTEGMVWFSDLEFFFELKALNQSLEVSNPVPSKKPASVSKWVGKVFEGKVYRARRSGYQIEEGITAGKIIFLREADNGAVQDGHRYWFRVIKDTKPEKELSGALIVALHDRQEDVVVGRKGFQVVLESPDGRQRNFSLHVVDDRVNPMEVSQFGNHPAIQKVNGYLELLDDLRKQVNEAERKFAESLPNLPPELEWRVCRDRSWLSRLVLAHRDGGSFDAAFVPLTFPRSEENLAELSGHVEELLAGGMEWTAMDRGRINLFGEQEITIEILPNALREVCEVVVDETINPRGESGWRDRRLIMHHEKWGEKEFVLMNVDHWTGTEVRRNAPRGYCGGSMSPFSSAGLGSDDWDD